MAKDKKKMKPQDLLETFTPGYENVQGTYWPFQYNSRHPLFQPAWIPRMLNDQRVQFGLWMIKGPILSASRFYVDEPKSTPQRQSELKKFLVKNIERFWRTLKLMLRTRPPGLRRTSAVKALRAIEWGFSGSEGMYKRIGDQIHFDCLKCFHPRDVKIVTREGKKVGMTVKRVWGRQQKVYLGGPKGFWHIHRREENPWYGLSRLFGSFQPWFEMHTDGGAKDIRKLYYRKYAFSGEVMYYPIGDAPVGGVVGDQQMYNNKHIASQLLEKRRTGGVMALTNTRYEDGTRKWELVSAQPGPGGADVLDYHRMMKMELFEGMGVPAEVAEAAEVGAGWSGRRVPFEAFFSILQEMVNWLIFDFNEQILRPLVRLNFGIEEPDYEVIPFGLLRGPGDIEKMGQEASATPEVQQERLDEERYSFEDFLYTPYRIAC